MRTRALALLAAVTAVLAAPASSAAPERTITLTPNARAATWTSDFRIGPYFGPGVGCDRDSLGCETMVIRLTRAGAVSVTTTLRVPTTAVGGQLILDLFRNDAKGTAGKPLTTHEQQSGATKSISARSLPAGSYLLEITWYNLAVGEYTGTASYRPSSPR